MFFRLAVLLYLFTWFDVACADDMAVPQFKAIVSRLESFFQTAPLVYDMQLSSNSPTGFLILARRYQVGSFRYDVKKTDSLITPFVGTVSFGMFEQQSTKCGSIQLNIDQYAASPEEIQKLVTKEECWRKWISGISSQRQIEYVMLITYGYSDSKWELREITSDYPGGAGLINYAIGGSLPGRQQTDLNTPWRRLSHGLVNSDPQ